MIDKCVENKTEKQTRKEKKFKTKIVSTLRHMIHNAKKFYYLINQTTEKANDN